VNRRDRASNRRPSPSRPGEPTRPGRRPATPIVSPASGLVSQTYLPPNVTAPRQARAVVRHTLDRWGLSGLSADAELLASELVSNAAEHASESPIRLTLLRHSEPNGRRGILCRVTDASPSPFQPQRPEPDSERGRGLQIVAALATSSGFTANRQGKTAWFTLTAVPDRTASTRNPGHEAEPGA
jgi:anti-sigma regulatory factor (Ser/Thr protein kinase)